MRSFTMAALCCLGLTSTAAAQGIVQQQIVGRDGIGIQIVEDPSWWRTQQHNDVLIRDLYSRDAVRARHDRYSDREDARRDRELRDLEVQAARLDERQKATYRELDKLWATCKSHKQSCSCDPCKQHEYLNYSWYQHYGYNWYPGCWGYAHTRFGGWR